MSKFPSSLLAGYSSFRNGRFSADRERYRKLAERGQKPKTMVIACCDSRAAPETIFDARPGEIFVVRNVANLVPPCQADGQCHSTSAALEFAVESLKVKNIVVLGHGRCGGIAAALSRGRQPKSDSDFIGNWLDLLVPAMKKIDADPNLPQAENQTPLELASIQCSLENLRNFPTISERETAGKLQLHGAWFDILLGILWVFDPKTNRFVEAGLPH